MPRLNFTFLIVDSLLGLLTWKPVEFKLDCNIGENLVKCCDVCQAKRKYNLFVRLNSFRLDIEDFTPS